MTNQDVRKNVNEIKKLAIQTLQNLDKADLAYRQFNEVRCKELGIAMSNDLVTIGTIVNNLLKPDDQ